MEQPKIISSSFVASLETLHAMIRWACQHIVAETNFSKSELNRIQVALEEALVNIIEHAYSYKTGKVDMTFRFFPRAFIELIIRDYGGPFNPLSNPQGIDTLATLKEREIGGLGIPMMRLLMDEVDYSRDGKSNLLTLRKRLP